MSLTMALSLTLCSVFPADSTLASPKADSVFSYSSIKTDSFVPLEKGKVLYEGFQNGLGNTFKSLSDTSRYKSLLKQKGNTLKNFAKSLLPKEYVKINSLQLNANAQFYFSNNENKPRGFAQNYVGYDVRSNISLVGLPFDVQVFFTTASGGPYGNLSGISVNFNYEKFLADLKASAMKQLENERKSSEQELKQSLLGEELSSLRKAINLELLQNPTDAKSFSLSKTDLSNSFGMDFDETLDWNNSANFLQTQSDSLTRNYTGNINLNSINLDSTYSAADSSRLTTSTDSTKSQTFSKLDTTITKTKKQVSRIDSLKRAYNFKAEEYRKQKALYEGEVNARAKEAKDYGNPDKLLSMIPMKDSQRKIFEHLASVKVLQFGNINPNYSKLYLANGGMQGINIAYNYKLLYVAGCAGKILSIPHVSYNQDFMRAVGNGVFRFDSYAAAGRLGVGRIESNNLIFSAIYTKHQQHNTDTVSANSIRNENLILSLSGNVKIKEIITLAAELAFANPNKAKEYNVSARDYFLVNSGATATLAVLVPEIKTKIKTEYSRIAPGFISGSQAFLRNDREDIKVKIEQPFLKSKIKLTSLFNYQRTDIGNLHNYKTSFYTYGGDVQFFFPKYPLVKVGYLGYQMQQKRLSELTDASFRSNFSNVYLLAVHNTTIKKTTLHQSVHVNFQYSQAFHQNNIGITYTGNIGHKSHDCGITLSTTKSLSDNNFDFTDIGVMYSFTHKVVMISNNTGVIIGRFSGYNPYNNTSINFKLNQFRIGLTNRLYALPVVNRVPIENILQFQFSWSLYQTQ